MSKGKSKKGDIKTLVDYITSLPTNREVSSWERKLVALHKLLEDVVPHEERILALMQEKGELLTQIQDLREQMVQECIHPKEHLIDFGEHVVCKFCERTLILPNTNE